MKIKTYQALTMQDAIRSIKEDLGPDAVILSTKQVRKGGHIFGLFSRSVIEVTAATDRDASPALTANPAPASTASRLSRGTSPPAQESEFQNALRGAMRSADRERHSSVGPAQRNERHCVESRMGEELRKRLEQIKAELRSLHAQVGSTMPRPTVDSSDDSTTADTMLYRELVARGVQPSTAYRLLKDIQSGLQPVDQQSPAALRHVLRRAVTKLIKVGGPLLGPNEETKTVLFIGATGVGKTTTIAKLAAHYRVEEKRSVSLITLDTYRVAAVEQLRTYANLLGVPLDIALTRREVLESIRRRQSSELILIDTGGRSPMDTEGLDELKELMAASRAWETHLVLSATTRERDLLSALARYAGLPIDRLLFTKLDETTGFGGILETMLQTGLPLSYFSTGQRVPEDLEVASPERLADLLLGLPLKPLGHTQAEQRNVAETTGHRPRRVQ